MKLVKSLAAWGRPEFEDVFKKEVHALQHVDLPLQQGLSQTSMVSDSAFSLVILQVLDLQQSIQVKTGVMYSGIIAGSCCADDPTPLDEQAEYCEILFAIDKATAQTSATLLPA